MLFNPDLQDTVLSYTFGIKTSSACRAFVGTFAQCYYYRGIFQLERPHNRPLERGAVLKHFGSAWVAHGLCAEAGGFEQLATFDERPTKAQLGSLRW